MLENCPFVFSFRHFSYLNGIQSHCVFISFDATENGTICRIELLNFSM